MKNQHFFNCAMRVINQYNRNTITYTEATSIILGLRLGIEYDASDEDMLDIKTTYTLISQYLTDKHNTQQ